MPGAMFANITDLLTPLPGQLSLMTTAALVEGRVPSLGPGLA
jgi:hypothetical protein